MEMSFTFVGVMPFLLLAPPRDHVVLLHVKLPRVGVVEAFLLSHFRALRWHLLPTIKRERRLRLQALDPFKLVEEILHRLIESDPLLVPVEGEQPDG